MMYKLVSVFSLLLVNLFAYSQSYISEPIKPNRWDTHHVVSLVQPKHDRQIQITSVFQRLPSKVKRKSVKMNGEHYAFIKNNGEINLHDAEGNTLAKRTIHAHHVVAAGAIFQRKLKWGTNQITYSDQKGEKAIEAFEKAGRIYLVKHNEAFPDALMLICLEDLMSTIRERAAMFTMVGF